MTAFKLEKIDGHLLQEHSRLAPGDHCYFFGEYAGGQGFGHGPMNQLIFNLKKPPIGRPPYELRYKDKAIEEAASLLVSASAWQKLKNWTWVPVPSSVPKQDEGHDDRLMKILLQARETGLTLDIRELITIKSNIGAAHMAKGKRPSVTDHINNFVFNFDKQLPLPKNIVVFDDVITTGASFKAAQHVLNKHCPSAMVIGLFLARSTRPN